MPDQAMCSPERRYEVPLHALHVIEVVLNLVRSTDTQVKSAGRTMTAALSCTEDYGPFSNVV